MSAFTRRSWCAAALALCACALAAPAMAADHGTRDEARALCDAATAHIRKVGIDQAAKDFATDRTRWMTKDLFPFVQEFGGTMRYHMSDKLVGKNAFEVRDASGKEFAKEMIALAKSGKTGWVDYEWAHPVTRKVEDKSAYIQRVPGAEMFVGVGIYR